jgi:hypothetical protein
LPVERIAKWPGFVDKDYFLGLAQLLLGKKQYLRLSTQAADSSNGPIVDLARNLIAPQVRIACHQYSLCLGSVLSL